MLVFALIRGQMLVVVGNYFSTNMRPRRGQTSPEIAAFNFI